MGLVLVALDRVASAQVWSWVGAATALATATYGCYVVIFGERLLARVTPATS